MYCIRQCGHTLFRILMFAPWERVDVEFNEFSVAKADAFKRTIEGLQYCGPWNASVTERWEKHCEDKEMFFEIISTCSKASGIKFDGCDLDKALPKNLRSGLLQSNVRKFYASGCTVSRGVVEELARIFSECCLETVEFDWTETNNLSLVHLVSSLSVHLTTLSFHGVGLVQEEFALLPQMLFEGGCFGLTYLFLGWNDIEDTAPIRDVVRICPRLDRIELGSNPLTSPGCVDSLMSVDVGIHTSLTKISLENTGIEKHEMRIMEWIGVHKQVSVVGLMAFASRRIKRGSSVSKLFSDVDRLVGSFLI